MRREFLLEDLWQRAWIVGEIRASFSKFLLLVHGGVNEGNFLILGFEVLGVGENGSEEDLGRGLLSDCLEKTRDFSYV